MDGSKGNIISRLEDIIAVLKKFEKERKMPKIEHGLILSKLEWIYDEISKLDIVKSDTESFEKNIPKPSDIEPVSKDEKVSKTEEKIVAGESFQLEDLSITSETSHSEGSNDIIEKHVNPVSEHHDVAVGETIAEKFKRNDPLINELLAKNLSKRDLSSMVHSKPVKDIESSIGVNERFLFIRDLFNSDSETFTKTIRILNSSSNFNEAYNYILKTFSWDMKSETVHKLLELVRRRFIVE